MALDIDLDVFRNKLADCKDRSQNLHFGVSSKSLKVEEHRQQIILQELRELENNLKYKDDRTNRTAAQILDIKDEVESGISSLKYLGGISNLENLYSELTGNIGACALHQSVNQNFPENMLVNKSLSNNVNDCWNYITKLAYLSQVHLRNASHYHQFHHDVNEITALLKKRWKIISNQIANFEPKGTIKESDQLANNLKDHQSYFMHLWTRIDNLQIESKKIVPIHLRQDPVSQNKVGGQCLYSYSSPEISVQDREEVVILNNSNPLTWKIQNNKGEIGEIPSVCIWIPGPDVISSEKPISLRTQLTKNWEQCLNRFSIVLIDHYINLFERLLSEPTVSVSKMDYFNNLLRDVQEVLLSNLTDLKSKELSAMLVELRKRVNHRNSDDSRSGHVYKESEIIKMHTPILRYIDHLKNLRSLRDSVQFNQRDSQNMSRDIRDKRYTSNIDMLNKLHSDNKHELNKLLQSIDSIPNEAYKHRHSQEFVHHSKVHDHINRDHRQFLSTSDLSHSHHYHLNSGHWDSHNELRPERRNVHSDVFSPSTSLSVSDAQLNRQDARDFQNFYSSENFVGNQEELNQEYSEHVKATYSLPMALDSTDFQSIKSKSHHPPKKKTWKVDSQTQLGVTVRDSKIQCNPTMYDESTFIQEEIFSTTESSIASSKQYSKSKSPQKYQLDAQTQIGVLFKDSSSQSEMNSTFSVPVTNPTRKKPKKLLIDSMTQIGCFTESVSTQANFEKKSISLNAFQMDAMTQISTLVNDRIVQTVKSKSKKMKRDCQTQIGTLQNEMVTQTNIHCKSKAIQKSTLQLDAITQLSILNRDADLQTDPIGKDFLDQVDLARSGPEKTVVYIRDNSTDMDVSDHRKNKRVQIGQSKLYGIGDFSSQTNYHSIEGNAQTNNEIDDYVILSETGTLQYEILTREPKETVDAEIQSDPSISKQKGKKVQIGSSKLLDTRESSCQIGTVLQNSELQTDDKLFIQTNEMSSPFEKELKDESTQWGSVPISNEIEQGMKRNKKLQIGNSRLEGNFESSCQTGHVVEEFHTQTEEFLFTEPMSLTSKEIQSDFELVDKYQIKLAMKGKKLQVGYPQTYDRVDVECQVGSSSFEAETETISLARNQFEMNEGQWTRATENKEIQIGCSRLDGDYETSCQTGHVVENFESQTEMDYTDHQIQRETMGNNLQAVKSQTKGKKIQVGYPQLNISFDFGCQFGDDLNDANIQTDSFEEYINPMSFTDGDIQWNEVEEGSQPISGQKAKKLQVGSSRLNADYEASCQTGHIVADIETQTEFLYNDENIITKEYSNKEIQPDSETVMTKGKKIQVGYPQINENHEKEIQIEIDIAEISMQTDQIGSEKEIINQRMFGLKLIDEELQYYGSLGDKLDDQLVYEGKNVQSGSPRLFNNLDESCQIGYVKREAECQTDNEFIEDLVITEVQVELHSQDALMQSKRKEYTEKEIQPILTFYKPLNKGKKIQVGHSKLNEFVEVECQSDISIEEIAVQTEVDEFVIEEVRNKNELAALFIDEMIEESVQYMADDEFSFQYPKETQEKNFQVGNPRIERDYDTSCQAGHLVRELEVQTEKEPFDDLETQITVTKDQLESQNIVRMANEFIEKEVQPDFFVSKKSQKSKKVQVGHPRLNSNLDVECQSGILIKEIEIQTEFDEFIIEQTTQINENLAQSSEEMIEEIIQYESENLRPISLETNSKVKKLQIGNSRLESDFDSSCQTGHLVAESEVQTEDNEWSEIGIEIKLAKEQAQFQNEALFKEYVDQEVQLDVVDSIGSLTRNTKCKKVQVGYPKLNPHIHEECQTECILHNENIQTENEEFIHEVVIDRSLEACLMNMEMVNETTQCNFEQIQPHDIKFEGIGKKLQVGTSRLEQDFDASCQTGHLVKDSSNQTEIGEEVYSTPFDSKLVLNEFQELTPKNTISMRESEIQTDDYQVFSVINSKKSKNVQVGHPRLNEFREVECQSGCIMDDVGVQCEVDEFMIMETKEKHLEASLFIDILIDETTQYDNEIVQEAIGSVEQKGKKLQVGISRMEGDFDVSCQTGRIIKDSECQTELSDSIDTLTITVHSKDFSEELEITPKKDYLEKEIQFETTGDSYSKPVNANKSKKVQVGHPRLSEFLDVECQSGCIMDDIGVQCEGDEFMIMESKERNLEASLLIEDLIDEATQYDDDYDETFQLAIKLQAEPKGRKLQVGIPRLDGDFDVSCQTGHLIKDSECQTELSDSIDTLTITVHSKDFSEKVEKTQKKDYSEKEIQFETTGDSYSKPVKANKSKKVQVGHPRLNGMLEVECQSGCIKDDVGVQCEVEEFMFMEQKERNLEASFLIDDMIDETTQYDDETGNLAIISQKEQKGKKLQVGKSRMEGDFDVSCQTGRIIKDSECQTELSDSIDTLTITVHSKDYSERLSKELTKDYSEKEVQFEAMGSSLLKEDNVMKSKKVQVGHPRLNEILDVECQSGCIMDDIGVQCEVDEFMIMESKERNLEASLLIYDLVDETTQYDNEIVQEAIGSVEQKGKKLQVGISRMEGDFDASCQTGRIIKDSECQTELSDSIDTLTITVHSKDFSEELEITPKKDYLEKEIQFETTGDSYSKPVNANKSKKVQVGHPRLSEILDVECQSGCIMDDIGVQCEGDEFMIMESKERNLEASLLIEDLIDEATQYDDDYDETLQVAIKLQAEPKGKKLQVGIPRLDGDFDVSCQTGHLIKDSECQTELSDSIDTLTITVHSKDYSERLSKELTKEYSEKEVQFEAIGSSLLKEDNVMKSKKVQVGHPRLNEILDVECQSGCIMDDIGVQCEVDEFMIMESKEKNLEASLFIDVLIDETTQYDNEIVQEAIGSVEQKGKKLQVGISRMEGDFDASCQTGRIIKDSECQTELSDSIDTLTITVHSKDFSEEVEKTLKKDYLEKEIQFETTGDSYSKPVKANKSKKVQVGHPRLSEILDVECQSGCIMDDVGVQCEGDEFMIMESKERNLEASLLIDDLIDETTQYDDKTGNVAITSQKEQKGKKLQVGKSRMEGDFDVSCQTGRIIKDSECQTELSDSIDTLTITVHSKDYSERLSKELTKDYSEKEVQFEAIGSLLLKEDNVMKSKKVQVGHPRLNEILDVECQSGCIMDDIGVQCGGDEFMIMESKERNLEASLLTYDLVDETTQYDDEVIIVTSNMQKEQKGKKLQVGISKLDGDLEVSCQTGHIIIDSECQTELDGLPDNVIITLNSKDFREFNEVPAKAYLEKEIQFETEEDTYLKQRKTNKSKKVQVGHPRLNGMLDVECQSGCIKDDVGVQCEVEEFMIMEQKERNLEASFLIDDMIDETTQYDDETGNVAIISQKEQRGKKLQVGTPRLDYDLEISCQTGHLIIDSESQTDLDNFNDIVAITIHSQDFNKDSRKRSWTNFIEKEIQVEMIDDSFSKDEKRNKSKKVQVGLSRLGVCSEVECQTGCIMDNTGVQCESDEFVIIDYKESNLERNLMTENLIHEEIQYDDENKNVQIYAPPELKSKKLQVGMSRLDFDLEVSCQTGHIIIDSECQAEFAEPNEIISISLNYEDFSEDKAMSKTKSFKDKEIQFDIFDNSLPKQHYQRNSKKVQVGHPRMNECREVECQSGCIMDDVGVQCEVDEFMIMETTERNLEASLLFDDLIDETTQYDGENMNVSIAAPHEGKGKKLQVGTARLDGDLEVSCQTGHLIMDSECQTDFEAAIDTIIITSQTQHFSVEEKKLITKSVVNKEIQFDKFEETKTNKSKKVQVGHPRLNGMLEVECQSGCIMDDVGVQCEVEEFIIMENKEKNLEASFLIDDMIDETTQYDDETDHVVITSQKEQKGKKLQVGNPRLEYDLEVSCQTGHLITDSGCQTEFDELTDMMTVTTNSQVFTETEMKRSLKNYSDQEIQFEILDDSFSEQAKTNKSKKVQVGHPKLNENLDVECQSGCIMDDIGVQCEVEEIMVMKRKEKNLEASFLIDDMIDETTQYDDETGHVVITSQKEQKGKKLQVGNPRLEYDLEVSCQTGHLITDSGCQTEFDELTDTMTVTTNSQVFSEADIKRPLKNYSDQEIQFEILDDSFSEQAKTNKSKKVQVGHPRLSEYQDVQCQSGSMMDDVGVQCEVEEFMVMESKEKNLEASFLIDDMIDETTQYDDETGHVVITSQKEQKGKKLQVGNPRLEYDLEVSCQTGHLITDSGCQTEFDELTDTMTVTTNSQVFSEADIKRPLKNYSDQEIQFEILDDSFSEQTKTNKSKKVQVGHPRLSEYQDVQCQSGSMMDDVGVQCEVEEFMVMESKEKNLEASFLIDDMIDETTQYDDETGHVVITSQKEQKGKKLQVGNPRLEYDLEVSCQTGHLITDSGCQTEFDELIDTMTVTTNSQVFSEADIKRPLKNYLDQEIQFEILDDSFSEQAKTNKSKKVQVGHPRLNENLDVECQSGCIMDDIGVQCEVEEFMVMESKEKNLEASFLIDDMIDETTQYDDETGHVVITSQKEQKGKKLQVGNPRLEYDLEVSCQTGHLITDSGCQTEFDELTDTMTVTTNSQVFSEADIKRPLKNYSDQEIQFEILDDSFSEQAKTKISKKVQVGHPRLNENLDVECQSGCIMDDVGVQCEMNDIVIIESRERNAEANLLIDDLIDETLQYGYENVKLSAALRVECKGKKLQVGTPRLEYDLEISCQTGHLIIDSECQTEISIETEKTEGFEHSFNYNYENTNAVAKLLIDREIQCEEIDDPLQDITSKSKKVQVGHGRLGKCREVECQSGCIMDDIGCQTEVVEVMVMDNKERSLEVGFLFDELMDESIQYQVSNSKLTVGLQVETKEKKLQIGTPRVDGELEVSCQTGHLIIESQCQTDLDEPTDMLIITDQTPDFTEQLNEEFVKEFREKEIQFDDLDDYGSLRDKINKSKNVQVGLARLNECREVECQSGCIMDDVGVQCEGDEFFIMESKERNLEASLLNDDLIDEVTQYVDENLNVLIDAPKEQKGKKLQVGGPRLDGELEVSCQTGHLIAECECQTELEETVDLITFSKLSQDFSEEKQKQSTFDFVDKEVQFEGTGDINSRDDNSSKSKKVQVGHGRLDECIDVECQSGCIMDDVGVQCEGDEFMIMEQKERNLEFSLLFEDLIDETTQYDENNLNVTIAAPITMKGKKLQVGSPRLELDSDASCQMGHLVFDSDCQTEMVDTISITKHVSVFSEEPIERHFKDFVEKEIQFELPDDSSSIINDVKLSKDVQVGQARLSEGKEVECQSGCIMYDVGVQMEVDEVMIITERERHTEKTFVLDLMIDEITQYGNEVMVSNSLERDLKNKKLQVGNSRLDIDSEASCQTGHLIANSECQTELDETTDINLTTPEFQELYEERQPIVKEFVEKEIQSEAIVETVPRYNRLSNNSQNIQVGHARLNECREFECQFEYLVNEIGAQTDAKEYIINVDKERNVGSIFLVDDLIDETIQYNETDNVSKKLKGKKLQVGNPWLDSDSEVSCQTGHLLIDSGCQTEPSDDSDTITITQHTQDFSEELKERPMKDFVEKEIQFEAVNGSISERSSLERSKKVQVGLSRLAESREVECQSECVVNEIGVETEEEECLVIEKKYKQEHLSVSHEMINEIIQYFIVDTTGVAMKKDQKGKKLQVGSPRLLGDMDMLCQTGHLLKNNECQTDKMTTIETFGNLSHESVASESFSTKSFSNHEIQCDLFEESVLPCNDQALQVGFPRLSEMRQISCQSTIETVDTLVQCNLVFTDEECQMRKQDCLNALIEETVQYISISTKPDTKDQRIQIGNARLENDIDVSYQTERFASDSICQTDLIEEENRIDFELALNQNQANDLVDYNSIEIQSDDINDLLCLEESRKERGVQIGLSRLNLSRDFDCQTQLQGEDVSVQSVADEASITEDKQQNLHSKSTFEYLIDEEIQFHCLHPRKIFVKESKGKKLQVGNSRLLVDLDEFTQTELDESQYIENVDSQEVAFQMANAISYSDKEVETFFDDEVDISSGNILKSHSVQVGYPRLDACVDFEGQYNYLFAVDVDVDGSDHLEYSEIEDHLFSKETLDKLIDETVQYSIGMQSSSYPSGNKVNKKLQVGSSRLEVDHDRSCQTKMEESENEVELGKTKERSVIQYSDQQTEPEYPMVSEFAMFKSIGVGVGKADAFQSFDNISRHESNLLGGNQRERLISVGTATWDYDKNKYKLLTFDLQYSNELMFEQQREDLEKSVQRLEPLLATVSKYVQVETELIDSLTQTFDYTGSHSVSIQISPKVPKFENEAHLILNYFNKQVDIGNDNLSSIENAISRFEPTQFVSCDIEKDFRKIFCDKMIQYSPRYPNYFNILTDFQSSMAIVEFDQQHNKKPELRDRLVSYLVRKSTSDACFEFDFFAGKSSTDISMIPTSQTKDFINLFESTAVQQERKSRKDEELPKKISTDSSEFTDFLEINLVPKLITTTTATTTTTDYRRIRLIDEEVMYEDVRSYVEASIEHDSSSSIDASYASKLHSGLNTDDRDSNPIESEEQLKSENLMDNAAMLQSDRTAYVEFSVNHDGTSDNLVDSKIVLENFLTESIEISLSPKLISNQPNRRTESIVTEVELPETYFKAISPLNSIQFDNKMTSTPELVEKSNFGTQVYVDPVYDGETQTNISSNDFGVQVTDSSSISPLTASLPLYSNEKQSILFNLRTAVHNSIATDVYFEDDYIVECVKSRSIVTKKQEVLPKFSHDFADNKEEPAKLFVTYPEKTKPKLVDTKTQSYHREHYKESCSQTHLELCFRDDELHKVYKKLISSKHLKEQGVQESNAEGLFELLVKTKGLRYILNRYQSASSIHEQSSQTEIVTKNSSKTQYEPETVKSIYVKETSSARDRFSVASADQDLAGSMISSFNSRPSHKNKRIQRGCSFFKLKDADTNTEESFGDHIEVTYTETILEESIITKRPLSKMDDHYDFSKSSSLTRRSASSTSIPVSNQIHRYIQSVIYPSQIFIQEENCDQYLTIIKSYHVTAVYDYSSRQYQSLREAFRIGIIDLDSDKYRQSDTEFISIETALEKGFLIIKHEL